MATTKLIVRSERVNNGGEATVYVRYGHQQKTAMISTRVKVPLEHWDDAKKQVKKSWRGFTKLNDLIGRVENDVLEIAVDLRLQRIEPTVQEVKRQYEMLHLAIEHTGKSFLDHFQGFIEERKPQFSPKTIAKYKTLKSHLADYEVHIDKSLTFASLDMEFYYSFVNFLYEDKEMNDNTVGGQIKNLKVFLNTMTEKGINHVRHYERFKRPKAPSQPFVLSIEELDILHSFDLSSRPRLERVRDLFLLGCSTGLRFGNYAQITKEQLTEKGLLVYPNKGKNDQILIPYTDYSLSILRKYPDGLPSLSDVKMNVYLKELGELLGFDKSVQRMRYAGSQKETKVFKQYELMTTHTARRIFITHSLQRGMRPEIIMRVTGHKDIRTMMLYVGVDIAEVISTMEKAWAK